MAGDPDSGAALPADVREALAQRNAIEAVKRLRAATGMGLKDALAVVQAHLEGRAPPPGLQARLNPVPASVPPVVLAALHQGQKIEAIRLLREHTGLGLKDAKDVVEALPQPARPDGLAPGEVPRSRSWRGLGVAAVLAVLLVWWWLRKA